jgi:TonB-dependent SusC/RagA subfamily outer membrane receptor
MRLSIQLFFFSAIFFIAGCSSTEQINATDDEEQEQSVQLINVRPADSISDDRNYHRSLADYLYRVPGINIRGSGNSTVVTIRGINSFQSGIEPLFVIDGQAAGSSYVEVNNNINVRDIDYVRVLKGSDAAIYGVRGGNGVIEIVTKK